MAIIFDKVNEIMNQYEKANDKKQITPFNSNDLNGLVYAEIPGSRSHKLNPKFEGPFLIMKQVTPVTFQLKHIITGREIIIHKEKIKRTTNEPQIDARRLGCLEDEIEDEEVEDINIPNLDLPINNENPNRPGTSNQYNLRKTTHKKGDDSYIYYD